MLSVRFDRNVLSGTSRLTISPSPVNDGNTDVYDVGIAMLHIEGNIFGTTDTYGVKMPYYANDGRHRFMKGSSITSLTANGAYAAWSQPWTYRNNSGNCPSETIPIILNNNSSTDYVYDSDFTYAVGGSALSRRVFCIPTDASDSGSDTADGWVIGFKGKRIAPFNNYTFMADGAGPEDRSYPQVALFPDIAMGNDSRTGTEATDDMFTVRFACVSSVKGFSFRSWPAPV